MNKRKLLLWLVTVCLLVVLLPTVAFAGGIEEWYEDPYTGEWYYYIDGEMVKDKVIQINGNYYGFNWEGEMYTDQTFWSEYYDGDNWYYGEFRAKADGKLYVNCWYQDGADWYYYGECGIGADDFEQIDGTWYFFKDGMMVTNKLVWSHEYQSCYIISADGKSSQKVNQSGWYSYGGNWYYIGEYGLYYDEVYKIDGAYYAFDYEGVMYDNERFWCWYYGEEDSIYGYFYAKKGGALVVNNWVQEGSNWYYYGNHGCAPDDFFKIGNTWYFFEGGRMVTDEIVWSADSQGYYIISADGASYKALPNSGWYEFRGGWYYMKDGQRVENKVLLIDGSYYAFNWDGEMYTNESFSMESYNSDTQEWVYSNYRAKANGALIVNNWYQDGDNWYYFGAEGKGARGFVKVGGVWYYFESSRMVTDSVQWDNNAQRYYALGKSGAMISSAGWHIVEERYVYAEAGGALAEGWKKFGNSWYYFDPYMLANDLTTIDGVLYAINNSGVCTAVTGNGTYDIGYGIAYVENGKVYNGWKQISGSWYYFDPYMITAEVYSIDDAKYVFDQTGKMFTGGWLWLGDYSGYYVYADSQGRAATGVKTIGGTKYIFDTWGEMYSDTIVTLGGVSYVVNKSGAVVSSDSINGWKQIGGKYYYKYDGYFVEGEAMVIDGNLYAFDYDGVMITNRIVDTYVRNWGHEYMLLGANGAALKGWQKQGGQWVYADSNGFLANGRTTIGGSEYIFSNCYMKTGTFVWDEKIITTNASGAIADEKDMAAGWTYSEGAVYYYKNGEPYTGWVGDYYVNDGRMQVNTAIYDAKADCYYAVNTYGCYVKSGWYQRQYPGNDNYGDYYYAKAGGKLARSEWVQLGSTWYYFDHIYMVYDTVIEIDGELCKFDENGKYLGTAGTITGKDGWKQVSGKWYYLHAGTPVTGKVYIDGNYYFFNGNGVMQTNGFVSEYGEYYYYVNSSGVVQKYTGWKKINNQWAYFDCNYRAVTGWFQDGGNCYYGDVYFNDRTDKLVVGLTTGWMTDGEYLHVFNSAGVYQGTRGVENGWYKYDGVWFYFENGKLAEGYRIVDGAGYYFYGGHMATNETLYVNGSYRYFGNDGKQVTKAGWLKTSNGWIYVREDGTLCNGIWKISGVEYYFSEGYMIR